jgi:hypothetical protein
MVWCLEVRVHGEMVNYGFEEYAQYAAGEN